MKKPRWRGIPGDAEVDMTPMLDIVFIMLIFFIVTSSFVRESGLDVSQQQNQQEPENSQAKDAVLLRVCANDDVILDEQRIDIRAVRANIERKLAENAGAIVLVAPEREASTGSLVKVMDQAMAAKATVSIAALSVACSAG